MLTQINGANDEPLDYRKRITETFAGMTISEPDHFESPSGRYRLEVYKGKHEDRKFWGYSQAKIYEGDTYLGTVTRNYSSFPFEWIEDHPDGHDYLFCAENYQGLTIVRLDTSERWDSLHSGGSSGLGWIWAGMCASPCKRFMAVEGCIWGGPYEIRIFDLSEPFKTSEKQLFRSQEFVEEGFEWTSEGFSYGYKADHCLMFDKCEYELTMDEMEQALEASGENEEHWDDVWEERTSSFVWKFPE